MHRVMGELISFRQNLAKQFCNPAFDIQMPTLNLGCLHAGDNPNRICSKAELQIDLRLLPGMDTAKIIQVLETQIQRIIEPCGTTLTLNTHYPPVPPFSTDLSGDLVKNLAAWSGHAPGTVAFGTEGHFLQSLGMQTVVFGPGSIDQAHQPNEFLARDQIGPTEQILRKAIARYCIG